MAEENSSILMRTVLVLAIVMVIVNAFNPGASAAWSLFTSTVQNGVNFPAAPQNPFNSVSSWAILLPRNVGLHNPDVVQGCAMGSFWKCLQPGPGLHNVSLTSSQFFSYKIADGAGYQLGAKVLVIQIVVVCNTTQSTSVENTTNTALFLSVNPDGSGGTSLSAGVACPKQNHIGVAYYNDTISGPSLGYTLGTFASHILNVSVAGGAPFFYTFHSIVIGLGLSNQVVCGDIICSVGQVAQGIANFFVLLGSGFVFVLFFVGALLIFAVQVIVGILFGLFSSLIFLLSIPGVPIWIQAVIDVFVFAMLVFVLWLVLGLGATLVGAATNKV